jgi:hypothetical protein
VERLKTLVMVESERAMASGKKSVELRCFLSSLPPDAERLEQNTDGSVPVPRIGTLTLAKTILLLAAG